MPGLQHAADEAPLGCSFFAAATAAAAGNKAAVGRGHGVQRSNKLHPPRTNRPWIVVVHCCCWKWSSWPLRLTTCRIVSNGHTTIHPGDVVVHCCCWKWMAGVGAAAAVTTTTTTATPQPLQKQQPPRSTTTTTLDNNHSQRPANEQGQQSWNTDFALSATMANQSLQDGQQQQQQPTTPRKMQIMKRTLQPQHLSSSKAAAVVVVGLGRQGEGVRRCAGAHF